MTQQYGNGNAMTVQLEGPFGTGGTAVKLTEIALPSGEWKGAVSPYSQVVDVEDVSVNSMVNLHLRADQIVNTAFTAENDGGVVTVYAIGDKPESDITIQATIMEVVA